LLGLTGRILSCPCPAASRCARWGMRLCNGSAPGGTMRLCSSSAPARCRAAEVGQQSGCCWGELPLPRPVPGRGEQQRPPALGSPGTLVAAARGCGGLLRRDRSGTSQQAELSGWVLGSAALPGACVLCVLPPRARVALLHPGAAASRGAGCGTSVLSWALDPRPPLRLLGRAWKQLPGERRFGQCSAPRGCRGGFWGRGNT